MLARALPYDLRLLRLQLRGEDLLRLASPACTIVASTLFIGTNGEHDWSPFPLAAGIGGAEHPNIERVQKSFSR